MRHFALVAAVLVATLLATPESMAQGGSASATQNVSINVAPVFKLSISSGANLSITTQGTAGATTLDEATDDQTKFSITQNKATSRLSVSLSQELPAGLTLTVNVPSVLGGEVKGPVEIQDGNSHDLLTGLANRGSAQNQTITYKLVALTTAAPVTETYQVTWTLTE